MLRNHDSRIVAALQAIRAYLQTDAVFVVHFTDGRDRLPWTVGDVSSFEAAGDEAGPPLQEDVWALTASGQLPNLVFDTQEEPLTRGLRQIEAAQIGAYVAVPLRFGDGELYGMLCAAHHDARTDFGDRDVRFLGAVAEIIVGELTDAATAETAAQEAGVRLRLLLDEERYHPVYQPIVSLATKRIVGFEALTRFDATPVQPPNVWFSQAADAGLGLRLELAAMQAAVMRAATLPAGAFLSLNCSPAVAASTEVRELLTGTSRPIVVELTEHHRVDDYAELQTGLSYLRDLGVSVAVDDAGAGFSSLTHIVRIAPDYIKLDLALTRHIDTDPVRRSLTTALCAFASDVGAVVVAEGIETHAEEQALEALGVGLGQGFYFSEPSSVWTEA